MKNSVPKQKLSTKQKIATVVIFGIPIAVLIAGIVMAIVATIDTTLFTAGMIMSLVSGVILLILIVTQVTGEAPWW